MSDGQQRFHQTIFLLDTSQETAFAQGFFHLGTHRVVIAQTYVGYTLYRCILIRTKPKSPPDLSHRPTFASSHTGQEDTFLFLKVPGILDSDSR